MDLTRDEILALPASPSFLALKEVVERVTGREVSGSSLLADLDSYSAPKGHIEVPNNDVEGLLHELCHWTVAGPRRDLYNYGLEKGDPGWRTAELEEVMCGWIQADLYERAGVEMPQSSVHWSDYTGYPWHRRTALQRWRRRVGWADREAVVAALKMEGGGIGLWSPW